MVYISGKYVALWFEAGQLAASEDFADGLIGNRQPSKFHSDDARMWWRRGYCYQMYRLEHHKSGGTDD